ncbi:MAG: 1-deoxy-D-xylulose-5-phosphate reductoisomerase, partial [Candidatus Dadabacteria bacterium]|nr:1-deoxy-D-xylulose-5-phosphate reductoisomerase [Candidatus Dadabacteria bacterium]
MKKISILGSTGSIGSQTLEIVRKFPERFEVTGLCGGRNIDLLAEQVMEFAPKVVSVNRKEDSERLKEIA